MFKVLKTDGPNLVTDLGCICITPFQYADGGKSQPVSSDDWKRMRDLFIAAPDLLEACKGVMDFMDGGVPLRPGSLLCDGIRAAIAKAESK